MIVSLLTLAVGFPNPIIFALLLNQIRHAKLRKTIQTISYAPYFLSTVIIVSLISMLFSANGLINGSSPIWAEARCFSPACRNGSCPCTWGHRSGRAWASTPSSSSPPWWGISPDYCEAAIMDGATRFQRILRIDIPLILPTIIPC